jgi:hypothetical protein
MHTRSKRYLRRHRARLRAQLRTSVKPFQSEDRLAKQIAVGMQKRWPEMAGYSRAHDLSSNRPLPVA